jgi:hypothetical protein
MALMVVAVFSLIPIGPAGASVPREPQGGTVKASAGSSIDARGTRISSQVLRDILATLRPRAGFPKRGDANFQAAKFLGKVDFSEAEFSGDVEFKEAEFLDNIWFHTTTFSKAQRLGPWTVGGQLGLDHAVFKDRLELDVTAEGILCRRTRFGAGVVLRIAGDIALEGVEFPVLLARSPKGPARGSGWYRCAVAMRPTSCWLGSISPHAGSPAPTTWTSFVSKVPHLRLHATGLKTARAVGYGPPLWTWTKRQTLAEEHQSRVGVGGIVKGVVDGPCRTGCRYAPRDQVGPV